MEIAYCSKRPILHPSTLLDFEYEIGPYCGCEHNCYYCYAQNDAEMDWARQVLVHRDYRSQLQHELETLKPQIIFIGRDTDPYQPIERRLRHTRQALLELRKRNLGACILTKSDLVARDFDLLSDMPGSSVGMSIAFGDEPTCRLFEERTPPIADRIAALVKAKAAGIETYVLISPVIPFVTPVEQLIDILNDCANTIWIYAADFRDMSDINWKNAWQILITHFPDSAEAIRQAVFSTDHEYYRDLRRTLQAIESRGAANLRIEF